MPIFDPSQIADYPTDPGVYLMKDARGEVIYIGKAKNLRARLRNYFSGADDRLNVTFLLNRLADIETIVTLNEKEAFLLEGNLIKKHEPRYNVMLKDDKSALAIRLDPGEEWPYIRLVRRRALKSNDGALYFGPFTSSAAVRQTIKLLLRIFPLRSCKDSMFYNRTRPCILYEIGKCCAPCVLPVDREEYAEMVKQVALFLKGRRDEVTSRLKQQMAAFSEKMEFEKAAAVRDKITAIRKTRELQQVDTLRADNQDVIALATDQGFHVIVIQHFRAGMLSASRHFKFRDVGQVPEQVLSHFITQFYNGNRLVPVEILLSHPTNDAPILEEILRQQRDGAVHLRVPLRGRLRVTVDRAKANALQQLRKTIAGERDMDQTLDVLQAKLNLPYRPEAIECVDISNIQGSMAVGSLVRFLHGEPDKGGYRRFKIKTVEGADDFGMMREVLTRRYGRLKREKQDMPQLLIVDGGKGQLNVAVSVMRDLNIKDIALAGLAKSRLKSDSGRSQKTRTDERLFLPNRKNPVLLKPGSPALYLVQRIRDEAHRFAITYHKKLRSAGNLRSILDEIPGIGPKRRKVLLRHFGSLARIKKATLDDIAAVDGIPRTLAKDLHAFFHKD